MTRRTTLSVGLVLLMFAVGTWFLRPDNAPATSTPDARQAQGPLMTASSQELDHAAYRAAPGEAGEWRANQETDGAWLQLDQAAASVVRRVVLVRPSATEPGVRAGYLRFSDGSTLSLRLDGPRTVVPFTPRRVSSVRFVVTEMDRGADVVALSELSMTGSAFDVDVATRAPRSGNLAKGADLSAVADDASSDLRPLVDGDPTTTAAPGSGIRLAWARPREITTVKVSGAGYGSTLQRGQLVFSDGSTLPVGGVTRDAARPTVLSFMPRVTTSVRLEVLETAEGDPADLRLGEVAVMQRGAPAAGAADVSSASGSALVIGPDDDCETSTDKADDDRSPIVLCPTTGAVVDGEVTVSVAAGPSYSTVSATAWSSEQLPTSAQGDEPATPVALPAVDAPLAADRTGTVTIDVSSLPAGPMVVQLTATGPTGSSLATNLQLVHGAGRAPVDPGTEVPSGRTLVYDEEFDGPVALSSEGRDADYASAKPESDGVSSFGTSPFLDPSSGLHPVEVVDDDYLRMRLQPLGKDGAAPEGSGRSRAGAMLASARPGGSGFSAQYGYFEARMLAPATPGTWPAFWTLSNPNLVAPEPVVSEIDAVELYGHDPLSTCHVNHEFPDPEKVSAGVCGQRWDTVSQAMTWHTYAAEVLPDRTTFYVDGQQVAELFTPEQGRDPMFFMINLATGGGWPGKQAATRGRADLYVDWVRVYV